MMDRDYALFVAVVDAGSLSAAARRLRLSPAVVSKRLAALETRLGARLIHRTTRRLLPTAAGQDFHSDMVAILGAVSAAEARLAERSGAVAGRLRVSAPTSFGRMHIAPYLKDFLDRHPRVELELDLSDAYADLLAERFDLAIRIGASTGSGLTAQRLATSHRILCASSLYLAERGHPRTIGDLKSHSLLAADGQLPWRLEGPAGPISVDGNSRIATNSSEVVREMALAGIGIALRSLWDVGREIADGQLVRIIPDHRGSADVGIYAVRPAGREAPAAVSAFIAFVENLYRPFAPWAEAARSVDDAAPGAPQKPDDGADHAHGGG
jgi:DNA-binding transcriptional LysR family regulator